MPKTITLQPESFIDAYAEDDTPLYRQPYPFHVTEDGEVLRQDFWQGDPIRVVGFTTDPDVHEIALSWQEFAADPQRAVGLHVVTQDDRGGMAAHIFAIDTVEVSE